LYQGFLSPIQIALGEEKYDVMTESLTEESVRRIDREGGTILGTSRETPIDYKGKNVLEQTVDFLNDQFTGTIVVGGNGSLSAAGEAAKRGLRVVGIPKTIDKNVAHTEMTVGFHTALEIVNQALTDVRSTAGSHHVIHFVEIMGDRSGQLAYWASTAAHPHFLTIPEVEIDPGELAHKIYERAASMVKKPGYVHDGRRYTIVAIAEGTRLKGVGEIKSGRKSPEGKVFESGVADYLAMKYRAAYGGVGPKVTRLGYLQRSGSPVHGDKILGAMFGKAAVDLLAQENFGRMVTRRNGDIVSMPLEDVIDRMTILDAKHCYDAENFRPAIGTRMYNHEIIVSNLRNKL